ncbi:hypothetical protein CYV26_11335 [Carnobacterium maltaromaticum]|uniref:DUF6602 domain-containing protein n=1 Tax=Carnobacterium maltaromaticum TaxID=2751 RepID=UPI000C789D05|nr:DUF6602 domain-containing protein [Carnobacterium maltaromaticum]PLS34095.1 hypothetical protein CYV30_12500 [Carnobacterium maltaromaticum]PLS34230.1 hypothetical protein CYV33_11320 [Carnobacterium maltaromaticum]PLS34366.1 hypothetical protein CYV31_12480 [Carnobacterium maltaromaticum]PLS41694.1 hypothetical protein CYV28_12435 [Carnobacterium maltaromaticum]PLS43176.1 hypothetical protein CYV27_11320 [Carnobacterium maltaromaticum]
MHDKFKGVTDDLFNYVNNNTKAMMSDEFNDLEYQRFLNSDDETLQAFRKRGEEWLNRTELNRLYIHHESSRGRQQEHIIMHGLMLNLGDESYRVVSGQIYTASEEEDSLAQYSTEQDIMVLRKGAQPIYSVPTFTLVSPEDVIVVIEVKSKIHGLTASGSSSLKSIIEKPKRVDLDQKHILFGIFGFEKSFMCKNLQRRGKSLPIVNQMVQKGAPRNLLIAASDKYFVRKYNGNNLYSNGGNHYYFEQGLAFGYFMANVMHHIDIQDGKDKGESIRARFPILEKTPAQVFP